MAKRTKLSPKEKALLTTVRDRWLQRCLYDQSFDENACREGVDWLYTSANLPKPNIIFVDSPWEAQVKANHLMGRTRPEDYVYEPFAEEGTIASIGWVAFFDFFQEIGDDIGECKDALNKLKSLLLSGLYDMIQLSDTCIVVKKPTEIHFEDSRLHNLNGPAVRFKDYDVYALNGRIFDQEWIWTEKNQHTLERFMQQDNEEVKAAMLAVMGGENAVKMLGAENVSTEQANGETYRLWKTKKKFPEADNKKLAWVEVECPSTKTHYFIGVQPKWNNALDAIASTWPGETAETYQLDQQT
jgi:hypothetical protein